MIVESLPCDIILYLLHAILFMYHICLLPFWAFTCAGCLDQPRRRSLFFATTFLPFQDIPNLAIPQGEELQRGVIFYSSGRITGVFVHGPDWSIHGLRPILYICHSGASYPFLYFLFSIVKACCGHLQHLIITGNIKIS
jgi:hypothetical protein